MPQPPKKFQQLYLSALDQKGFGGLFFVCSYVFSGFSSRKRYLYEGIEGWGIIAYLARLLASFSARNFNHCLQNWSY